MRTKIKILLHTKFTSTTIFIPNIYLSSAYLSHKKSNKEKSFAQKVLNNA